MRTVNNKLILASVLILLLLASTFIFFKDDSKVTRHTGQILNYGSSICTQDMPSSNCGSYDVDIQTVDGSKYTFKVDGFSNSERDLYDQISADIKRAKDQKAVVSIDVNGADYIVSVER